MPLGNLILERKETIIIGAGISGLLLGYFLKRHGHHVTIYEKGPKIGGKIQTKILPSGLVEESANALFTSDAVWSLVEELGLKEISAQKKLKRAIFRHSCISSPLSKWEMLKLFPKVFRQIPKLSSRSTVADLFLPLLGRGIVDEVLSPGLQGIYAVSAEKLNAFAVFPKVQNFRGSYWQLFRQRQKQKRPKESINFAYGLEDFISSLSKFIDEIHLNHEVRGLSEFQATGKNVCICSDAPVAAALVEPISAEVGLHLKTLNYEALTSASIFLKNPLKNLQNHFGVLFPQSAGFSSKGVLADCEIFPHFSKQAFSYKLIAPHGTKLSQMISDLERLENRSLENDIVEAHQQSWEQGIPRYDRNLWKLHELFRKKPASLPNGLILFGNYTNGLSIRAMIESAQEFSKCS